MRVELTVLSGPNAGTPRILQGPGRFLIGTSAEAAIRIPNGDDCYVSTRQAQFIFEGGLYRIQDLGSATATRVNGEPVSACELRDGDLVQFGNTSFRIRLLDKEDRSQSRSAGENPAKLDDTRSVWDRQRRLEANVVQTRCEPVDVFISYSHEDEPLRAHLAKHLAVLQRNGLIRIWFDREITAGTEWNEEIREHLESAQIILLLVSPDFMTSNYCYDVEMKRALERHDSGDAKVIPVILRPVIWRDTPFARLNALPTDGRPVKSWTDLDSAFLNVAEELSRAIRSQRSKMSRSGVAGNRR